MSIQFQYTVFCSIVVISTEVYIWHCIYHRSNTWVIYSLCVIFFSILHTCTNWN